MMHSPIAIFVLFATGYFISNLWRGVNVAIAPFLQQEMGLDNSSLGLLTSLYFIGFALAQLPAGVALDRFGAQKTHAYLLLVCALGGALFAFSPHLWGLMIGRLLIGVGIAVALAGSGLMYTQVFSAHRLPLLMGLTVGIGGLGGVVVGEPFRYLLQYVDWRTALACIALATMAVALLIGLVLRLPERVLPVPQHVSLWQGTRQVFASWTFWRWVSLPAATGGVFYAAHSLWVRPFMAQVLAYSPEQIALEISVIGLAMVLGTTATGVLARRVESWGISLFAFSGIGMLSFMLVQGLLILQVPLPSVLLWFAFGFAGSSWTVNFACAPRLFEPALLGRALTSYNIVFFISIFTTQILMGYAVAYWEGQGLSPAMAQQLTWGSFLAFQTVVALVYCWPARQR